MYTGRTAVALVAATFALTASAGLGEQSSLNVRRNAPLTRDSISRIARLRLPSIVFVQTALEAEDGSGSVSLSIPRGS